MLVYPSGPMTGIKDDNTPAFEAAERYLRDQGHDVISPVEISQQVKDSIPEPTWGDFIRADLMAILNFKVDALYLLKGWQGSPGARLELQVAAAIGCQIWLEQ
jgi:hypothetical protein